MKALQVNLAEDSSAEVKLNLSAQYPSGLSFDIELTNSSSSRKVNVTTSEFTVTAIPGLYTRMGLAGITYDQGRYPLAQHSSGNISFTFEANGTVKEGAYPLLLKINAYPVPAWFNSSKIESVEVPIILQIGKNAAPAPTEQATDPSTYAWALSATIAMAVLAAVVVLLLRRPRQ